MTRASRLPTAALAGLLVSTALVGSDDGPVYTRASVEVDTTGETTYRRAYAKRIELPRADCDGDAFTCMGHRVYGQVYGISFVEQTVSRSPNGEELLEQTDRGQLLIALELPPDVEHSFEEPGGGHHRGWRLL